MTAGSLLFGFLAGLFSTLSPCVLPLLPLILGSAAAAHRFGMLALATGMAVSFVAIGLFAATIGVAIGLTGEGFRIVSAAALGAIGIVLLSGALRQRFAVATAGISNAGNTLMARFTPEGIGGQALIGLILGAIWSPCVGPTLGAASLMAARGQNLSDAAAVMLAFAIGAAAPLVLVGSLSRQALAAWRGRLLTAGATGKSLLGISAVTIAFLILTGLDHHLEAALLRLAPDWLTDLTTRY